MNYIVDINCDLGESFGHFKTGQDEAVFPYLTSCNIACGFHAGDPKHMAKTIDLAIQHNVRIGAHPSYPDLAGFGRRNMDFAKVELKAIIQYQVGALQGIAKSKGQKVAYVKPHGALYNTAARNEKEAEAVIEAIIELGDDIALMGLAGSMIQEMAKEKGLSFIAEAFADRRYEADGSLMSRKKKGAVIHSPNDAVEQVLSIVHDHKVKTQDGTTVPIEAQSICIHGDHPQAIAILKAIRAAFSTTI